MISPRSCHLFEFTNFISECLAENWQRVIVQNKCVDGWMDGWMDGRMDGWMDGWGHQVCPNQRHWSSLWGGRMVRR